MKLIDILFFKNKGKAAQQILTVIFKSFEQYGEDETQDRGSRQVARAMLKTHADIFKAYKNYIYDYYSQDVTSENFKNWIVSALFILTEILSMDKHSLNKDIQSIFVS